MMKKIQILLIIVGMFLMASCDFFKDKSKEAIQICQNAKIQELSGNIFGERIGLKTNLDFANMIAQQNPTDKYMWSARQADEFEPGVYLVSFHNENRWGFNWEVVLDDKIVRKINGDEFLSRKYGMSRVDSSGEFLVESANIDINAKGKVPGVILSINGFVKNNTDKVIISSKLSGSFKLIFEKKVVSVDSGFSNGFLKPASKENPWLPGSLREFKMQLDPVDPIYSSYNPPYVVLILSLNADDPVGYVFDKDLYEYNMQESWSRLSNKTKSDVLTNK